MSGQHDDLEAAHAARAEALRESEEKLRLAVDGTRMGLWSWELTTDAFEWSPRMCEIMGQPEPVPPRQYVERCVHPEDRTLMAHELESILAGTAHFPVHRIVRPDGEVRWVAPVGSLIRDDAGTPVRIRGGVVDVTERHQTEERLQQLQKLDAVGGLTAGVAHNFNNVLAVILPAIETALRDPVLPSGSKTRKRLEDASEAARRAAHLVSQLMTSAGQRTPEVRSLVDVHSLLRGVVSMCRQTFERQLRLELTCEGAPAPVHGDAAALEQVFLNLLLNGRDALSGAPRQTQPCIEVQVVQRPGPGDEPGEVHVRVRDNGPGMSDAVRARLFEPFFTTKPPGQGTGLGLATSLAIVRSHHGRIDIRSELGRGTICDVSLPCASGVAQRVPTDATPTPRTASRSTILLVDDEGAIRAVIRQILEDAGHFVAEAESASAAVQVVQGGFVPELVLLDRSMPGWPVRRAVQELRTHAAGAALVFFTGQNVPDEEAALVDGVLYKPLSMVELNYAIARYLRR